MITESSKLYHFSVLHITKTVDIYISNNAMFNAKKFYFTCTQVWGSTLECKVAKRWWIETKELLSCKMSH